MSQAPPSATSRQTANRSVVLSNIDWATYTRLVRAFAESHGSRLAYDRGELEIMSPLLEHEDESRFLHRLVVILTEELGLPLHAGGSTTLRRRRRRRGVAADECFWIASAPLIAGRRRLDLRTDPPPDLAIEVDVTRSSLDRLSLYAALVVPEVWRWADDTLTYYLLSGGQYQAASGSRSFPGLAPDDVRGPLLQARTAPDHNAVALAFRTWVRQRLVGGTPPPP